MSVGDTGPLADPLLRRMFPAWERYRSHAQAWAVQLLRTAPPGGVVLTALATGGGKTLTYALPLLEEREKHGRAGALVVVPTISLAVDQAAALAERYECAVGSLRAAEVHGSLSFEERRSRESAFACGDLDVLLVGPERALQPEFIERLRGMGEHLRFLVIDEVHTMLDWGETFRLEYPRLGWLRRELLSANPALRTHLMSATVPPSAEKRLRETFSCPKLTDPWRSVRGSTLRFEAEIQVQALAATTHTASIAWLQEHIQELPRPGLIYLTVPAHADVTATKVTGWGYRCAAYHGGTTEADRQRISRAWIAGELDFVAGTSAFGLGIDKPDVRSVTHLCIPESLDRYYQEIGRAGRDGRRCLASLVTVEEDREVALGNAKRLLTMEKFEARWQELLDQGECLEDTGDEVYWLVDEGRLPAYAPPREALGYEIPNDFHTRWNRSLLNFLERLGVVRYEGSFPLAIEGLMTEETSFHLMQLGWNLGRSQRRSHLARLRFPQAPGPGWLQRRSQMLNAWRILPHASATWGSVVRIERRAIDRESAALTAFRELVEQRRTSELAASYRATEEMIDYARRPPSSCMRAQIAALYGESVRTCGMCQWCIAQGCGRSTTWQPSKPRAWGGYESALSPELRSLTGSSGLLIGYYTGPPNRGLVEKLKRAGFRQFIVPGGCQPGGGLVHWFEEFLPDLAVLETTPTVWLIPPGAPEPLINRVLGAFTDHANVPDADNPNVLLLPETMHWEGLDVFLDRFPGPKMPVSVVESKLLAV